MKTIVQRCITTLPLLVFIVILSVVIVTNQFVSLGNEVRDADTTIYSLQEQNEVLRQEIASASSLLTLETHARARGFVPALQVLTMGSDAFPVAVNLVR